MAKNTKPRHERVILRIDLTPEERDRIKVLAKRQTRTMSGQIAVWLREKIQHEEATQ